jgi:versiconal hemiacetal acetate reductase
MYLLFPLNSLGKSGLQISKVILGTMSFGTDKWQDWVLNEDKALPLLEYAFKRGINTWDTVSRDLLLIYL